jgi:hypothetical protein
MVPSATARYLSQLDQHQPLTEVYLFAQAQLAAICRRALHDQPTLSLRRRVNLFKVDVMGGSMDFQIKRVTSDRPNALFQPEKF